jgi:hypothetical protein
VALALNAELGTAFVGRNPAELDMTIEVDRSWQRRAIACHRSQAVDNVVLRRRLELLGSREVFRWLRTPAALPFAAPPGRQRVRVD